MGTFYKDVIAGHISTERISNNKDFYGVFYDGESHYYLDGSTYKSGMIPVLVYDNEKDIYEEIEVNKLENGLSLECMKL